eukprot:c20460_g1_i1.p1 GENE.c20460_g1_i1~~c20460_g1_i1.p1  ORF type:complete len:804 (+),score=294.03 c20460_g1_i1:22-2433(+)
MQNTKFSSGNALATLRTSISSLHPGQPESEDLDVQMKNIIANAPSHRDLVSSAQPEATAYGAYHDASMNAQVMSSARRANLRSSGGREKLEDNDELDTLDPDGLKKGEGGVSYMSEEHRGQHAILDKLAQPSRLHTLIFIILLGILSGFLMVLFLLTTGLIQKWHGQFVDLSEDIYARTFLVFFYQASWLMLAVFVTKNIQPLSAGSGIPEMKSMLSGVNIPGYLSPATFTAKVLGLGCVIGCGAFIGIEGPAVHWTSAIAEMLMKWKPFQYIGSTQVLRHQVLSTACAIGIASTFGAPVGGVLFSLEVTAAYFLTANYAKCFLGATSAAICIKILSSYTGLSLFQTSFGESPFSRGELIFFAFTGTLGGALGSLFTILVENLILWRRSHPKLLGSSYYMWTLLICLVANLVCFPYWSFMRTSIFGCLQDLFTNTDLRTNPASNADWNQHPGIIFNLFMFIVVKLLVITFAITCPTPAGIFTPIFLIGAALGRLVGEILAQAYPDGLEDGYAISPGGYAVVGAAAMATGSTATISTAIIAFELTGEMRHLVPTLLAVLCALGVSNLMNGSFYDMISRLRGLPYLSSPKNPQSYLLMASQVMDEGFSSVNNMMTAVQLAKVLEASPNKLIFPLVESVDSMLLIGCIHRKGLDYIIRRTLLSHVIRLKQQGKGTKGDEIMRKAEGEGKSTVTHSKQAHADPMAEINLRAESASGALKRRGADEIQVKADGVTQQVIDLDIQTKINFDSAHFAWLVDASPYQVVEETPLAKVYHMLMMLGASRIYVTRLGALVGEVSTEHLASQKL